MKFSIDLLLLAAVFGSGVLATEELEARVADPATAIIPRPKNKGLKAGEYYCTGGVAGSGKCEQYGLNTFCCSDRPSAEYNTHRTCETTFSDYTPPGAPNCPGGGMRLCC